MPRTRAQHILLHIICAQRIYSFIVIEERPSPFLSDCILHKVDGSMSGRCARTPIPRTSTCMSVIRGHRNKHQEQRGLGAFPTTRPRRAESRTSRGKPKRSSPSGVRSPVSTGGAGRWTRRHGSSKRGSRGCLA